MLILMQAGASAEELEGVYEAVRALGLVPHPIPGSSRVAVGVTGNRGPLDPRHSDVRALADLSGQRL